jgi:hypothetical protein
VENEATQLVARVTDVCHSKPMRVGPTQVRPSATPRRSATTPTTTKPRCIAALPCRTTRVARSTDSEAAATYPLFAFQKKTAEVLEEHRQFFESLVNLSRVIVIGHSLAGVDLPYFRDVTNRNQDCTWTVWYHRQPERERLKQQLTSCGVNVDKIEMIPVPEF